MGQLEWVCGHKTMARDLVGNTTIELCVHVFTLTISSHLSLSLLL